MAEQIVLYGDCTKLDPAKLGHHVMGTDPPYSPRVHAGMTSTCAQGSGNRHRDAGFEPLSDELRDYLSAAAAAAERWSLVYSDLEGIGAWAAVLPRYVRTIVMAEGDDPPPWQFPWVRWSMPQKSGDRPPSGAEAVVLGHNAKGRMQWAGPGTGNALALSHKALRGDDKYTAEKPLDQALDLVAWFSWPDELWADLTAGWCTFGVACALLGRSYLGVELNAAAAQRGAQRVAEAQHGRLSPRDLERFERWAASVGEPGADPLAFRGARFHKGRRVLEYEAPDKPRRRGR